MAIGTSRMHSHLFYTFPFRSFSWAIPLLAQVTPLAREVLRLLDAFVLMGALMTFAHFILIILEFWGMPGILITALFHWLCYHMFATVTFPLLMFYIYDRDMTDVPDSNKRLWLVLIFLLTIFLDKQTKYVCDLVFGIPPDFADSEVQKAFDVIARYFFKDLL